MLALKDCFTRIKIALVDLAAAIIETKVCQCDVKFNGCLVNVEDSKIHLKVGKFFEIDFIVYFSLENVYQIGKMFV